MLIKVTHVCVRVQRTAPSDSALSVHSSRRCVQFLKYSRPRSSSWQHFWQPYAWVRLPTSGSHREWEDYSRTKTAPASVYGCQTRSVALGEGLRLRVFENRVLRKMFGSERVKVTRDMRGFKMCRIQGNKMKKNEMGGARGTYGENTMHTMDRDRIGLVQSRRNEWALVNTAMNLRFRHTWRTA